MWVYNVYHEPGRKTWMYWHVYRPLLVDSQSPNNNTSRKLASADRCTWIVYIIVSLLSDRWQRKNREIELRKIICFTKMYLSILYLYLVSILSYFFIDNSLDHTPSYLGKTLIFLSNSPWNKYSFKSCWMLNPIYGLCGCL